MTPLRLVLIMSATNRTLAKSVRRKVHEFTKLMYVHCGVNIMVTWAGMSAEGQPVVGV